MRHDGGLLIALGAGLGLLVSICNYFAPTALLAPTSRRRRHPGRPPRHRRHRRSSSSPASSSAARRRHAALVDLPVLGSARRHPRHRARRLAAREPAPPRADARLPRSAGCSASPPAGGRADDPRRSAPRSSPSPSPRAAQDGTWPTFNGDLRAQKFSPLTEITPENVADLAVAWQMHTGDVSDGVHPAHAACTGPAGQRAAADRLVGDAALRQRHALRRHALLPHLRPRARHRRGQVDLRQPRRRSRR